MKAITNLASHVHCWSRNDDKRLYRLVCYLDTTVTHNLTGRVGDPPECLELRLYVDADFAGDWEDTKSTSGGYLVLYGPHTYMPISWMCKKQTSTSRSTTESEVVSLAASLFAEVIPMMQLWSTMLGRNIHLTICEDNTATIKVLQKGYSPKLRHVARTHKINLGSVFECLQEGDIELEYCHTDLQAADVFTKAVAPQKWDKAMELLGIKPNPQTAAVIAKMNE